MSSGGFSVLNQVILADIASLRWRMVRPNLRIPFWTRARLTLFFFVQLSMGVIQLPFLINVFVASEVVQGVLPNWRWGACRSISSVSTGRCSG